MNIKPKDYQVVRYYKSGFRPALIQDNLTFEQAMNICRANNSTLAEGESLPRLWVDIAQRKGLL